MKHHYENVPRLGNVAFSRKALAAAERLGLTQAKLTDILMHGKDRPDGMDVVWREKSGVRLVVVMHPEPFNGSRLVVTLFQIQAQANTR